MTRVLKTLRLSYRQPCVITSKANSTAGLKFKSPGAFKRLLSRLVDIEILKTESEKNGLLELKMVRGDYQLSTKNAVYSFGRQYHAFNQAFKELNLDQPLKSVLVLGGGLGSVCEILQMEYAQNPKFTLVEYDEHICQLAKSTLRPEVLKQCKFVNKDAAFFVKNCREQYDLIIVDLFQDIIVPDAFLQESFLKQLAALFATNCRLLFNMIVTTNEAEERALSFYKDIFVTVFPQATKIQGKGNLILSNKLGV